MNEFQSCGNQKDRGNNGKKLSTFYRISRMLNACLLSSHLSCEFLPAFSSWSKRNLLNLMSGPNVKKKGKPVARSRGSHEKPFIISSRGDLPLVITMPHGGVLRPAFIPDQTTSIKKADSHTKLLGTCIADGLEEIFGQRPFTVASCAHRCKVDLNRPLKSEFLGTIACTDPMGILIWHQYHNAIATALEECLRRFGCCLLIDLHGQNHGNDYVELGYSLTMADLAKADRHLDSQPCTVSTLGSPVSQTVRGPHSLGACLTAADIKACPSPKLPRPTSSLFFEGGYTAWHYAGMKFDGNPGFGRPGVATIQCETPYISRQNPKSSPPFDGYGVKFAQGLANFLQHWANEPRATRETRPSRIQAVGVKTNSDSEAVDSTPCSSKAALSPKPKQQDSVPSPRSEAPKPYQLLSPRLSSFDFKPTKASKPIQSAPTSMQITPSKQDITRRSEANTPAKQNQTATKSKQGATPARQDASMLRSNSLSIAAKTESCPRSKRQETASSLRSLSKPSTQTPSKTRTLICPVGSSSTLRQSSSRPSSRSGFPKPSLSIAKATGALPKSGSATRLNGLHGLPPPMLSPTSPSHGRHFYFFDYTRTEVTSSNRQRTASLGVTDFWVEGLYSRPVPDITFGISYIGRDVMFDPCSCLFS
eukprot:g1774.t1